jgi:uncharacterized protein
MNRLKNESSPYLLSHSENPVDWYPWGEEAFKKAAEKDRPVFLSIGYSSCHWCHVMEKESFEDLDVAKALNDDFISIKVDREERPDIDKYYMNICQLLTGSGGWPLSLLLTPDKKPFFAATYLPKRTMHGRIGIIDLLNKIICLWKDEREKVYESSVGILKAIDEFEKSLPREEVTEDTFRSAFLEIQGIYDKSFGGFGRSPKFPMTQNLDFLFRYHHRYSESLAIEMALNTLKNMRNGGIWDHVGKGFHRYSTDRAWVVPHFEKMLYDQSLLASSYLEAFKVSGDAFYKDTAVGIFDYIRERMTSEEGAFFTSEDADSEGEEGRFYYWSRKELMEIFGEEGFSLFSSYFDIRGGKNILFLKKEPQDKEASVLNSLLEKLAASREKRTRPFRDEKILLDLNAMTVSALAKGSDVLDRDDYLERAARATGFMLKRLKGDNGLLYHSYAAGKVGSIAFLDDYAYFIQALLDMYESTFQINYLEQAMNYNEYLLKNYWDETNGGFYFTHKTMGESLFKKKEFSDGALPSGNAIAMSNLARIGKLTQNRELIEKAYDVMRAVSQSLKKTPLAYISMLNSYDFLTGKTYEIVIVGEKGSDMERDLKKRYLPNKVVLLIAKDVEDRIRKIAGYTSAMKTIGDKTTVYVCKDYKCSLPVNDIDGFSKLLKD